MLIKMPKFAPMLGPLMAGLGGHPDLDVFSEYFFALARHDPATAIVVITQLFQVSWNLPRQKLSCVFYRLRSSLNQTDCGQVTISEQIKTVPKFAEALDKVIGHSRIIPKAGKSQGGSIGDNQKDMINQLLKILRTQYSVIVEKGLRNILDFVLTFGDKPDINAITNLKLHNTSALLYATYLMAARPADVTAEPKADEVEAIRVVYKNYLSTPLHLNPEAIRTSDGTRTRSKHSWVKMNKFGIESMWTQGPHCSTW